jgi:RNA polymerase sigma-70 factor (ECF subfamily)
MEKRSSRPNRTAQIGLGCSVTFRIMSESKPVAATSTGLSSRALLRRAEDGDVNALTALFERQGHALRRWARGRLPRWARSLVDTSDLVQDAMLQTFRRLPAFDNRGRGALQAYLREAVANRIRDELRRVDRRPTLEALDETLRDHGASPYHQAAESERQRRYKEALATLTPSEQTLVVGRIEMGYTFDQLALVSGRATPEAARVALRRAILKLADIMARSA